MQRIGRESVLDVPKGKNGNQSCWSRWRRQRVLVAEVREVSSCGIMKAMGKIWILFRMRWEAIRRPWGVESCKMIYLLKVSGLWWGNKSRLRDTGWDAEVSNEGGDSIWKIESVPSCQPECYRCLSFLDPWFSNNYIPKSFLGNLF